MPGDYRLDLYSVLLFGSLLTIAISGICILSGVILIKLGYRDFHKGAMISASVFAIIFVALYLTGSTLFPHTIYAGPHRTLYLTVLWSHTLLAIVNIPMAVTTIYLALYKRFDRHKRIAPYTAGVWIYVALTGWLIYFFLK